MYLQRRGGGETTLSARALLEALLAIEDEQGRDRP
jgi:7,8-dihydro-6-hydroxymethylpterin-pyrophosphokinase